MNDSYQVLIVLGSDSDFSNPAVQKCMDLLDEFCIPFDCKVRSCHRDLEGMLLLSKELNNLTMYSEVKTVIFAGGLVFALPGVFKVPPEVIKIVLPLDALALTSNLDLPDGCGYSVVGVGKGQTAALMAATIVAMATNCHNLLAKITNFSVTQQKARVEAGDAKVFAKMVEHRRETAGKIRQQLAAEAIT